MITSFITPINEALKFMAGINQATLLAVILAAGTFVLLTILGNLRKAGKASGLANHQSTVSIDGNNAIPARHYISQTQGLAGKPDALISENGFIIPVERKPLARKLRDRYVAQILVYMRLVEEFEGKKPPYGYLILGPNCRSFKIENSEARQKWLQGYLDQMQAYLNDSKSVVPLPHPRKCTKCDVNFHCKYAYGKQVVNIGKVENQ